QPGTTRTLDSLDDRLFGAMIHKEKIMGTSTLWTAHNIAVTAGGVGDSSGDRNGSRWYEIGSLTGTPTLVQSGTLFDSAGSNPLGYWIPSVTMSGQGHMAIGTSRAGASAANGFASVAVAGRVRTDASGTTQAPTLAQSSTFPYVVDPTPPPPSPPPPQRWGDYSQVGVDPNDDMTMWTFQEYANATNSYGVRAIKLVAPPPATPASANPSALPPGMSSVSVTITGVSSAGSEFFDPGPDTGGPGFANHIAASVSGGVTVNSVIFNSPTQVTLNISTVGAPPSAKDVTIINPDGQTRTGTGILAVVPLLTINDVTLNEGNAGTTTFPFTVTLSSSSPQTVTVNYMTADGTATVSDNDYMAASGMLTFSPGQTSKTVNVAVRGDTRFEGNETFFVNLGSPTNATIARGQGTGTILNDDGRTGFCRPIVSLPYTITIQGNYCLVQNLSTAITTGNAITITSDFVNLDLKGFKIGGGSGGAGTQANGVYALNRKNITIKNGNIRGFFRAVFLEDNSGTFTASQGHLVSNLRADENTYAGIHVQGRGSLIRNNQVVTTGGTTVFGANADAYGIRTEGAEARVLNNDVTDTNPLGAGAGSAIAVAQASGAVIEKNRLANSAANNSFGIYAASGDGVLIMGNRISGTAFGVFYQGATGRYRDNLATGVATPYTGGTNAGNNQ
ncbi:MAG TPA: Calx-beta domain-containing protein, partial [Gemmatimonadales bacterium]|nr:Calx-beta domain-containing protein [Gemmatimonadales bacterium]